MLKVIQGPFAALEEQLLDDLSAKPKWEPVLVVARSNRVIRRLQRLLAARGTVLGVRFTTLERLVRDLVYGADAVPVEDPLLLQRLVLELLEKVFTGTKFLGGALRSPKTAQALLGAIMDLKEAGMPPERLSEALPAKELVDKDKLEEVFKLYELYERALAEHRLLDRADMLRVAAQRLDRLPERIVFYGYYDLNQAQLDFFGALVREKSVQMYFPCSEVPATRIARRFYETHLAGLAGSSQALPLRSPLLETLFAEQITPVSADVTVMNAAGTHDEVWAVAKEILRLGIPFERIGVVARSLQPYADTIDRIFHEHAIPFGCSARRSIRSTPLARTVELLLLAPELDYDRPTVIELLSSGFVRKPEGSDPVLWDLATSRLGIGRGESEWRSRISQGVVNGGVLLRGKERTVAVSVPQLQMLLETFDRITRARLPEDGSWKELSSACLTILRTVLTADLGRVGEAVASLAALDAVALRPVTRREFVQTLLERFDETTEEIGYDNVAGVQVIDAMAARGLRFDVVFIIGLNEKVFPRFITEEPFIKDHNRSVLRALLGGKLDPRLMGYDDERMLFWLALGSAPKVYLSYQRADDEGRPLAPSTFLRDVVYRLRGAEGKKFDEFVRQLPRMPSERIEQMPIETLTPAELFMRGFRSEEFAPIVQELESMGGLGPRDGVIGGGFESFWRSYSKRVSPTAVERYAACPLQCYFRHVLKLEPFERPEDVDEVTPLELGNLAHAILHRFYRQYKGGPPEALLESIWREETEKFEREAFVRFPLLWKVQSRHVLTLVRRFLLEFDLPRLGASPKVFPEQEAGPVELAGVQFKGRLDRISFVDGALRVDDYKWKQNEEDLQKVALTCERVQLPIYVRLAEAFAREQGLQVSRIEAYLILMRRLQSFSSVDEAAGEKAVEVERGLDPGFWEKHGRAFEDNLAKLVRLFGQGLFFVNPGEWCRNCDFATACRKNHLPTARRPRRDPRVKDYYDVREG